MTDNFKGDNAKLVECINALLELDASGNLAPHGIGGSARPLLEASASRLAALAQQAGAVGGEVCTWTCTDHPYEGVTWDSTCGVKYCFTEDGPEENGHKFCHSCGKPMSVLNIASSGTGGGGGES